MMKSLAGCGWRRFSLFGDKQEQISAISCDCFKNFLNGKREKKGIKWS